MKTLYESILRPDTDIMQEVELEPILRKYGWYVKDAYWMGKTLRLVFDGRGYMDDIDKVAEELQCKKFSVYPWAIITSKTPLKGFTIDAQTRLDIEAPELNGCSLTSKSMGTTIINPKGVQKVKIINCDFHATSLSFDGMDGATLIGNNFNEISRLTLKHVGPKIEKIVLGWNLVTKYKDRWTTYPYPKGKPDRNMDPMKELGLNKHFKNIARLTLAFKTGADDAYIEFLTTNKRGQFDWGVGGQIELTNGFQCNIVRDARCV